MLSLLMHRYNGMSDSYKYTYIINMSILTPHIGNIMQ